MRRARRGFSLIEMLMVITGLMAIFGICAGLLHAMIRLDRGARAHALEAATCDRVARQFRRDVRAATAESAAAQSRLNLVLPDGRTVVYDGAKGRLDRTARQGDVVERRESYRLPSRGVPRFQIFDEQGSRFATLLLPSTVDSKAPPPRREIRIDAELSRDRRLAAAGKDAR